MTHSYRRISLDTLLWSLGGFAEDPALRSPFGGLVTAGSGCTDTGNSRLWGSNCVGGSAGTAFYMTGEGAHPGGIHGYTNAAAVTASAVISNLQP